MHRFDRPAVIQEPRREPIEQFGMRRSLPHNPEVIGCLHKSGAEQLIPHAIDGDPRRQRVLGAYRPFRQGQPIVGLTARQRRQVVRCVGLYALGARRVHASRQNVSVCERRLLP